MLFQKIIDMNVKNYLDKTNFYKVELYSVKVRDREGMGKGQVRDRYETGKGQLRNRYGWGAVITVR